jgi:N-ethylmaleimide reductase
LQKASEDNCLFGFYKLLLKYQEMSQSFPTLFSSFSLGGLRLKNRIVMAPMTRSRATGNQPNELMARYYSDRADAGLIITEGTSPSPNGLGYARIPGIFSDEQAKGWATVTSAVHARNGKIFLQLMHTGRVAHSLNIPSGAKVVAPSAVAAAGQMWTDQQGMQAQPTPHEMSLEDISATIAEYVESAKAAIKAGFDGVEIHAANGYLPMQFLNPGSNQRSDAYGGDTEGRNHFVLELAEKISLAIGKEKTGIRLSPSNPFNEMAVYEEADKQYLSLVEGLNKIGVVYIHFVGFMGYALSESLFKNIKSAFRGAIILNGGFNAQTAEAALSQGRADLISFGVPFIANPDFVQRILDGTDLAAPDQASFYSPGEAGYTDYPKANEKKEVSIA